MRILLFAFGLAAWAQERIVERAPTGFVDNGKQVSLEVVIFKPAGPGPFPALLFNHGSTGRGDNPELFTRTWTSLGVARFFNERGWLVAFPQRRGRGNSEGLYDEGFEPDRLRYTCTPKLSLAGLERAMQDIDAAVEYVKNRKDVDPSRMLIGGQSRGGILAIAYAGSRSQHFIGAINFVGGWIGEGCKDVRAINTATFKHGAGFKKPTLWLYGENDPFYSLPHSRSNFDAFVGERGNGTFLTYSLGEGKNGHLLIGSPELWQSAVSAYLEKLGQLQH